ncbi:universal stress protein [Pedococcus bigeumensis]|uniref:Universal stress protein n=1 Tax=Pedococcus bigeumensis TaxID=433644 RepID=A0A502CZ90_9MICO|nr:universal stress protein [Pedococcus bigeumensis]TPG17952.1 universal stress protein [Pedococcus bigeumensis]
MKYPRVVAWLRAGPSVRVMARATAESAVRRAELCLLSPAPPPPQWSSWRSAAASLGVTASWQVVADGSCDGVPDALLAEAARAALVVTDTGSLGVAARSQLAQLVDVYVVAKPQVQVLTWLREPAVVVGVPDSPDSTHLVSAAGREAVLRHRDLIVLHAQSRAVDVPRHVLERRWLTALPSDNSGAPHPSSRVVVTDRPVTDALRDHVEAGDVLVVGVHSPCGVLTGNLDASLLEAPPCDLLLTRAAEHPAGDTAPSPLGLNLAV